MREERIKVQIHSDSAVAPIAMMVQIASRYESRIYIDCENKHVNAKSIMGMMSLSLTTGEEVCVTADGPDEEKAILNMVKYMTGC